MPYFRENNSACAAGFAVSVFLAPYVLRSRVVESYAFSSPRTSRKDSSSSAVYLLIMSYEQSSSVREYAEMRLRRSIRHAAVVLVCAMAGVFYDFPPLAEYVTRTSRLPRREPVVS